MKELQQHFSPFQLGHMLAWVTMLLFFLFPFVAYWEFNAFGTEFYLRQGKSCLAINAIIAVFLSSIGAALGGYWWRFVNYVGPRHQKVNHTCNILLTLLLIGYFLHYATNPEYQGEDIPPLYYYVSAGTIMLVPIGLSFVKNREIFHHIVSLPKIKKWSTQRYSINIAFFSILLIALCLNNLFDILRSDLPLGASISLFLGRCCLYTGLCTLFVIFIEFLLRCTPKPLQWAIWSMYSTLLICVILDAFTSNLGRPLFNYINSFTELGEFNWRQELKGANFHGLANMHISIALLICVAFFGFCYLFVWQFAKISKFIKWKFSFTHFIIVGIAGLLLNISEQGIGRYWKDLEVRRSEQQIFGIHLPFFQAHQGIGDYNIQFIAQNYQKTPTYLKEDLTTRPNVYFIMVESMRADTLTKDITPFLHDFRNNDCQQFTHTWSGSNATHLSWYSIFHSMPPVHWGTTIEAQKNGKAYVGSPTVAWLKSQDYNIEVRAVCDLGYKDFGVTNFGTGQFTSLIHDAKPKGEYGHISGMTEREVHLFKETQQSILKNPENGNFYYLALDSPHYNYYWHHTFEPPFKDYLVNIKLPISPSKEEILQFKKRYWNACAWVDFQVKGFVNFLKENDKYDNSVIIIVGDHGEEFKEHGNWFHCSNLTPEQTEVPILIKWPKGTNAPAKTHASHLDIMPTLMKYMGASNKTLKPFQGIDLLSPRDEQTTILTTNYPGTTGYTMRLRKNNLSASFSWKYYWTSTMPTELALNNINENGIPLPIKASNREAASAKGMKLLKEKFPDAFERFFKMSPLNE